MSSSSYQKLHQNSPINAWKSLVFPTIKLSDLASLFLLLFTSFFIFFSVYLTVYYHPHNLHHTSKSLISQDSSQFLENKEQTNISHIVFGIGGSTKTWQNRRHYTEFWWHPNVTRGFIWLEKEILFQANNTWPETLPYYKLSGNTSSFRYSCSYGSRSAIRIARILKETFELGLENVRWFVMGDDDTVFFTENLVTVLAKYDHNEMYYIGGNSESVEQDLIHSYALAFGGGGFAVSYPLAAALVKILDGCINRYAKFYGSDQKIQGCIGEIGVPITKELGFHQIDLHGNIYGLLAAHPLVPLVSLHHLDYVDPIFPNTTRVESVKKLVSTYRSDPGRILQQSICYDPVRNWSISVSWGYSVELHRFLLTPNELQTPLRTFRTWRSWSIDPFTFNTRPDFAPCERPLVFFMDRVENVDQGTRSTYRRYDDVSLKGVNCTLPALEVQYVNVTAKYFMQELWKKAPRRQCCDIIRGADEANNVVEVEIRDCRYFESVTPS